MRSNPPEHRRPDSHEALQAPARAALVRLLTASDAPMGAPELASASGLHITTVRHHLDVLVRCALVVAEAQPSTSRGRPRLLYRPAPAAEVTGGSSGTGGDSGAAVDGYQRLAEALAAVLAGQVDGGPVDVEGDDGSAQVCDALFGLENAAPGGPEVGEQLVDGARRTGFDPELRTRPATGETTVLLHACPYREVASRHPEVVCGLHRAVLATLEERFGGGRRLTLVPSEGSGVCRIVVETHPTHSGDPTDDAAE